MCALLHIAVAGLIYWRRRADGMALLAATTLLVSGVTASEIVLVLDEAGPLWWMSLQVAAILNTVLLTCFYLFFPSGRLSPHRSWWIVPLLAGGAIALDLLPYVVGYNREIGRLNSFVFDAWLVSLVVVQAYRYLRTAPPAEQQQTRWVLGGLIVAHGGYALIDNIRLALRRGRI
jgi:hypothetical protein